LINTSSRRKEGKKGKEEESESFIYWQLFDDKMIKQLRRVYISTIWLTNIWIYTLPLCFCLCFSHSLSLPLCLSLSLSLSLFIYIRISATTTIYINMLLCSMLFLILIALYSAYDRPRPQKNPPIFRPTPLKI